MATLTSSITVKDMVIKWNERADHWVFEMSAPTEGWLALGFNTKNSIVHTNLIMATVKAGVLESEDLYVVGFGNPQPVEKLGGKSAIHQLQGEEKAGRTTIRFSIPKTAIDKYHYDLQPGQDLWLICAYSRADEFDHHSTMRQHVQVKL